jgi:hypothetical protein
MPDLSERPCHIPVTMDLGTRYHAFGEEPLGVVPFDKQSLFETRSPGSGHRRKHVIALFGIPHSAGSAKLSGGYA